MKTPFSQMEIANINYQGTNHTEVNVVAENPGNTDFISQWRHERYNLRSNNLGIKNSLLDIYYFLICDYPTQGLESVTPSFSGKQYSLSSLQYISLWELGLYQLPIQSQRLVKEPNP